MSIITIDCGASFIKGAVIKNNNIIKQLQKEAPVVYGEKVITNTKQIDALILIVKKMIMELATELKEFKLCISNEMHGFILAYQNGIPYTDYISWQKEFGAIGENGNRPIDLLGDKKYSEDILYTGMPLRAGLPSCNLLYLSQNGYCDKKKSCLYFYTLGDYIIKRLSGQEPKCHPTNAAATGLFDLRSTTWNQKLIHVVRGDELIFPDIGTESICFEMEGKKITVFPALGDQQAALLGAGLNKDDMISFNLGTGSQVSKIVHKPIYSGNYQIRPYFGGEYLKTIPHLPSGRALNVYIRFIKGILQAFHIDESDESIWKVLLEEEKKIQSSQLRCDLSFFENSITNCNVGKIYNIGEYTLSIGELIYTVFSQMSSNFIWAADIIEPNPLLVKEIIFTGGVARKITSIRNQILRHYDKNINMHIVSDETLLGLYKYGMGLLPTMLGED